jgi:hypothetical protein
MSFIATLRITSLAIVAAFVLALGSVYIERTGPELAAYGNLCGPRADDPCLEPVLKGGYPLAYLVDTPGIAVERKLAFVEDQLLPSALILDIAIYFMLVLSAILLRSGQFRRRRTTRSR